jgi:hypothetical protein
MIEETPPVRGMSEKELRARIDRVIAEEERTYGRLLELRDQFEAVIGELDRAALDPTAIAEHLKHCCPAIAVSPEQAMITPLRSVASCSPATRPGASPLTLPSCQGLLQH